MSTWPQRGRGWTSRRIERRIAVYCVATILVISLLFGAASLAASLWIARQHQRVDSAHRLDRIVARLDDKVDLFVRHTQDLSKSSIVVTALLDSRGRNIHLLPFLSHYRFPLAEPHGLALCDFEGKLLAQQNLQLVSCLAERPQSRAVIDTEQRQAIIAVIERKPYLTLFQPVFYPDAGRAEGYILAALDLQALVAEKNLTEPNATLTLHARDGTLDFATRAGALVLPERSNESPTRPLFAAGPFAAAGLTLVLHEPSALFAGFEYLLLGFGFGTLALAALALALSRQLARRIAEPLLTLNRTARQIAAQGPAAGLASVDRADEIGELAVSFNHMVATLYRTQEELEVRVQARTEELRRALVKVEQSEEQVRAILDSMSYHIAVLDRDGAIVAINESWRRFALENGSQPGDPRPELGVNYLKVCREASDAWSKEAMAAHDGIQAVLAGQQSDFTLEYPCHTAREQRWFIMRVTPLRTGTRGVVIAHADITERKQAELRLRVYLEYQRAVLDNFPFMTWLKDRESRFLAVNAPFARACGAASPEALMGLSDLDVWPADLAEAYRADDQAVLASGQPKHVEEWIEQAGQPRCWFETYKSPVILEGQVIGTVGFARDITDRKEAEHLLTVQRDLLLVLKQVDSPVIAMQAILDAALSFSGVDSGGIYEVDPNDGCLILRVQCGFSAAYVAAVRTRTSDSLAAMIVRAGQPRYSFIDPPYSEPPDFIQAEGLRAYAIIPILHCGQVIACFNLASHRAQEIPLTTCQALETLALQLGGILARLSTQAELEEQRINLSAVFDTLEDFLFILDEYGRILRVNRAVERRLGYPQQDLLGRHVVDVHPPDQREEAERIVAAMLAGQADFCPVPLLARSGQQIPVETRVVSGQWSNRPALIGLSRDITARKRAEDALRESEARFHTLVDLLPYGVLESDLTGRVVFANPALERLYGYEEEGSVVGRFIWEFLADDAKQGFLSDYLQLLIRDQPPPTTYHTKQRCTDGSVFDAQVDWAYRRDAHGRVQGFIAVVTDITARKRLQENLQEQAIRDPLTGLFNRRYLDETLPRELSRCRRSGEPLTVAMLDLDHFKRFNDAYGHEAGDVVLRAVGGLLSHSMRAGDLPCRYGGEELTLILQGSTLDDARTRLESLRQAIMQMRVLYQGGDLPAITVSIGVAATGEQEMDAAVLLARADAALYRAKEQGRNRVVVDGE
jgi:diguanylate cyclase (GGDEF)-like protein/PAS domain S-box-containing protein